MARPRGGYQKKIDSVHWTVGSFTIQGLAAGVAGITVAAAQHLPETLLRIRGEFLASLSSAVADGVGVGLTMGLILVPEGTGTTVLWSPSTDGDAPWIWWDTAQLFYTEQATDDAWPVGVQVRRIIDSKAMRKVRNTELQFVAENSTLLAAGSIDVAGEVRVLAGS